MKILKKIESLFSHAIDRKLVNCQRVVVYHEVQFSSLSFKGRLGIEKVRIVAEFVPRTLADNQKEHQVKTCHTLKQHLETEPDFL